MKLFNTIITLDAYCVANTGDSALEAILEMLKSGELSPSYRAALEIKASPVRPQWRDERAIVAADVDDADFALIRGKTTQQVYEFLTKHPRSGK